MKILRMLSLNETSRSMLSNVARLFDRMMNQIHSPGLHSGCVRSLQVPFAQQLDNLATKSTAMHCCQWQERSVLGVMQYLHQ